MFLGTTRCDTADACTNQRQAYLAGIESAACIVLHRGLLDLGKYQLGKPCTRDPSQVRVLSAHAGQRHNGTRGCMMAGYVNNHQRLNQWPTLHLLYLVELGLVVDVQATACADAIGRAGAVGL